MPNGNNKIAVVYKSKYGSTRRYAEWIAEEVNADLFERSQVSLDDLFKYGTIIYGGSLHAAGIMGISFLKKDFDSIKDKKVIVFSVGASPAHPEALEDVKNSNFTDQMKERVHYFHLRGGFDFSKLNVIDKFLMFLMKKKIEMKKGELSGDEKGMLECFDHPADWTDKEAIMPIIKCISGK